MKDIQILEYCDYCWADGERKTPSTTGWQISITSADRKVRNAVAGILTCDEHGKVIADLADLVAEHGEPMAGPVAPTAQRELPYQYNAPPTVHCPVCDLTMQRPRLAEHVWEIHVGHARPARPTVCPDCGYVPPNGTDPRRVTTGVGKHRSSMHGYDPLAEALAAYEAKTKRKRKR